MLAIVSRTEGSEKLVMREATDFRGVSWLRGVDLNHRPLGYECYCSRNLMDLRGAKSNVTSSLGSLRNCNCPRIALLGAPTSRDGYLALFYAAIQVDCRRR